MQNDIIRKLREQLSQPITDEKTVVYVIVEIRKLMDLRQVPPGKYLTLRFYCNWAVHTALSGEKAIEVLKLMDDALELKRKGPLTGEQDLYLQDGKCCNFENADGIAPR
jgi:hypothetical protein